MYTWDEVDQSIFENIIHIIRTFNSKLSFIEWSKSDDKSHRYKVIRMT